MIHTSYVCTCYQHTRCRRSEGAFVLLAAAAVPYFLIEVWKDNFHEWCLAMNVAVSFLLSPSPFLPRSFFSGRRVASCKAGYVSAEVLACMVAIWGMPVHDARVAGTVPSSSRQRCCASATLGCACSLSGFAWIGSWML